MDDYDSINIKLIDTHIKVYGVKKIKGIISQTQGNLYYYRIDDTPCECDTEEETIIEIVNKFISYVSIKENAFEISNTPSWVKLKGRKNDEIVIITDTDMTLRDIKKSVITAFDACTTTRKIYCKVTSREEINGIQYIPYPKEIMDILTSRRKDIIKGELR